MLFAFCYFQSCLKNIFGAVKKWGRKFESRGGHYCRRSVRKKRRGSKIVKNADFFVERVLKMGKNCRGEQNYISKHKCEI